MKIIDEKGRIFGKINVIDFLVVLFLVFLMPMFYFGYKILNTKKVVVIEKTKTIQVEVKFLNILLEVANVIKEGDAARDSAGDVKGILIKIVTIVTNESPKLYLLVAKDNQFVVIPNPYSQSRDMLAVLDLKCAQQDRALYFDTYVVKIGSPILFSTDLYDIQGTIVSIKNR